MNRLRNGLLLGLVLVSGCGGEASPTAISEPPLTVAQALERGDGSYTVAGALFVEDRNVRLCGAIAESYPPQCGRPWLTVQGLDLSQIVLQQAEAGSVRWAESVELVGDLRGQVLVARSP